MLIRSKAQRVLVALIASLFIFSLSNVARAQLSDDGRWQNGVSEPWWFDAATMPKEEIAAAQSRWTAIEAENQNAVADEWAGDYFIGGDTHGSYLRWSPQSGFVLVHVDKCQAKVMSLDYGRAVASPSMVQFFPELNKKTSGHGHGHAASMPLRFIPVKWRGAHHLIPENEIADFGDYVAGLGKYNDWAGQYIELIEFFVRMRDGEADAAAQDAPVVPPGYEHFIKQPIDAMMTAVGKKLVRRDAENEWWDELVIPVTLNAGTANGIKPGMKFSIVGSERGEDLEVQQVGLRTSRGVIVRSVRKKPCVKFSAADDCAEPEYEEIKIGNRVSTSMFRK